MTTLNIRLFENKETKAVDRFTLIINDDVFTLSDNANAPDGINMYCCPTSQVRWDNIGEEVNIDELPDMEIIYNYTGLARAVTDRVTSHLESLLNL